MAGKRLTQEEFITRSKLKHGKDKYGYHLVNYINSDINVDIFCNDCGNCFKQKPRHHMDGSGCKNCFRKRNKENHPSRFTKEKFVEKSRKIHGEDYGYDLVNYINDATEVDIYCRKCNKYFKQVAGKHMSGSRCIDCIHRERTKTTAEFIKEAIEKRGEEFFDYSRVNYINAKTEIDIFCKKKHGWIKITPNNFFNKNYGCPECGKEMMTRKLLKGTTPKTTKEFIVDAKKIHGEEFIYDHVNYTHCAVEILIGCRKHGLFYQRPNVHLQGKGCPKCNMSKGERVIIRYLEENNIEYKFQEKVTGLNVNSRFDFYLTRFNEQWFIEFNGGQHYYPVSFGSKKENAGFDNFYRFIKNDDLKLHWTQQNSQNLLIIPYWEIKRIPEILDIFFSGKMPIFSEPPQKVKDYQFIREKISKEGLNEENLKILKSIEIKP